MRFQQLLPCLFIVGVLGRRGPSKPVHQALREHDLVHQSHYPYAWGMDEMHHGRADEEEEVKQVSRHKRMNKKDAEHNHTPGWFHKTEEHWFHKGEQQSHHASLAEIEEAFLSGLE